MHRHIALKHLHCKLCKMCHVCEHVNKVIDHQQVNQLKESAIVLSFLLTDLLLYGWHVKY